MSADGTFVERRGDPKMCEGWLEHKNHTQIGKVWQKIWLVLRGHVIYVFKCNDTSKANQLGNLTIDRDTTFTNLKGDQRKGFRFELKTGRRHNKFKTANSSQREEWRAYVVGLASGRVPVDIDLLAREVSEIQDKINSYARGVPPSNTTQQTGNRNSVVSGGSGESGIGSVDTTSGVSGISRLYPGSSGSSSSPSRSSQQLDMGGPTMVHRFYRDRSDPRGVPSWFFARCPRHTAETVLLNNRNHGNTLIRESSTHKDNGSYVISKSFFNDSKKQYEVEHYEVMRVANGYKINVENTQPEMTCLEAVIDFFVSTTSGSAKPLTTNDLVTLGMAEPDYETRRIRGSPEPPAEPWKWPPPDYDHEPRRSDPRTVNPRVMQERHSGYNQARSPDNRWSSGRQRQAPATFAFYPKRESVRTSTGMDDIHNRVKQTETLNYLDSAIDTGFDQEYINVEHVQSRQQSPPPPVPHRIISHNYVNNEHDNKFVPPSRPRTSSQSSFERPEKEDPALRSLPEAPPPPTYKTNRNSVSDSPMSPKSPLSPAPVTPNVQGQQPAQKSVTHSNSTDPVVTPGKFVPPPLKKTIGEGAIRFNPKSPGSPASFPSWNDPKPVPKSALSQNVQSQNVAQNRQSQNVAQNVQSQNVAQTVQLQNAAQSESDTSDAATAGVDDTNPGGVSDLKSRFEKKPGPVQSPTSPKAKASPAPTGKGPISRTNIRGTHLSASFDISTNTRDFPRTNTRRISTPDRPSGEELEGRMTVTNTLNLTNHFDDDENIYDDTALPPEDAPAIQSAEKRVAFQQDEQPGMVTGHTDQRRKTEPSLTLPKHQFKGTRAESFDQGMSIPSRGSRDYQDGHGAPPPSPPRCCHSEGYLPQSGHSGVPVAPPPPPLPSAGPQNTWREQQQQQQQQRQQHHQQKAAPTTAPKTWGRTDTPGSRPLPQRPLMDDHSDFTRKGMQMAARRGRRQTEPAIFAQEAPSSQPTAPSGLSDDFKRMLEGKLGGVAKPSRPAHVQFNLHDGEDDYDAIEPDGVTYLDDRFNTDA